MLYAAVSTSPTERSCDYNGVTYDSGGSWMGDDGCNICTCRNGNVGCTRMACKPCHYKGGVTKQSGDSWKAPDGCNKCSCTNGLTMCTLKTCGCQRDGYLYHTGETFKCVNRINYYIGHGHVL